MDPTPTPTYGQEPTPDFWKRWPNGKTRSGVTITWPANQRPPEERAAIDADIFYRATHRTGWQNFKELMSGLWRMFGLFNTDPYIARISMIQEAGRQIDTQRQITADNRVEDQARQAEQARLQGRAMADAMIERLEERGFKQ